VKALAEGAGLGSDPLGERWHWRWWHSFLGTTAASACLGGVRLVIGVSTSSAAGVLSGILM